MQRKSETPCWCPRGVFWLTKRLQNSNFAGIIGPLGATWDTSLEEWKRVIEVNTVGVWLCNKYQLRQMMKQDSIEVWVCPIETPLHQQFQGPTKLIYHEFIVKSTVRHNEDRL